MIELQLSCFGGGGTARPPLDLKRTSRAFQSLQKLSATRQSSSVTSFSSYSFQIPETGMGAEQPKAKPVRPDTMRLTQPPTMPQSERDIEGRSLAGRKKTLKINLDLALVSFAFTSYRAARSLPNHNPKHHLTFSVCFHAYISVSQPSSYILQYSIELVKRE